MILTLSFHHEVEGYLWLSDSTTRDNSCKIRDFSSWPLETTNIGCETSIPLCTRDINSVYWTIPLYILSKKERYNFFEFPSRCRGLNWWYNFSLPILLLFSLWKDVEVYLGRQITSVSGSNFVEFMSNVFFCSIPDKIYLLCKQRFLNNLFSHKTEVPNK